MSCPHQNHASCETDCLAGCGRRSRSAARIPGRKSPNAAQRAIAGLVDAIQSLDTFPGRGRPTGIEGVRELIVPYGRSAYVMRYFHFADVDEVVVLRIWHGREQRD